MFKALGKLKVGKDKSKKEKPEKQDDAQTAPKNSKHKDTEKHKEKERQKSRNISKRKKGAGTNSNGDLSRSSEEIISGKSSPTTVFEDHADVHRVKGKKQISKKCEEAVNKAVAEFFDCAWTACAERFYIQAAPTIVTLELRNTWLRIVEMEWQDPDMRENKPSTKHNKIFKRDGPPLPLTYDSWSRGALEPLPSERRESVLDPFLRDINYFQESSYRNDPQISFSGSQIDGELVENLGISSPGGSQDGVIVFPSAEAGDFPENVDKTTTADGKSASVEDIAEKDVWNFALDREISYKFDPVSEPNSNSDYKITTDSRPSVMEPLYTVLSARLLTDESTTERELSSPLSSQNSLPRKPKSQKPKRKFSPSQCGGRVGSGVFRLPLETTSEALLRMNQSSPDNVRKEGRQIVEQNAEEREDIVRITRKGEPSEVEEEELEVQPLFEERTPRVVTAEETRYSGYAWRRPSYRDLHFKGSGLISLDQVTSDINSRFLKRRLVNLHGHFKRQAMRSLAAAAKRTEALLKQAMASPPSSSVYSRSSYASSSNRTNRITRNTISYKRPTQSSSFMNISRGDSESRVLSRSNAAVGVTSDSRLGSTKMDKRKGKAGYDGKHDGKGQQPKNKFKAMGNVRASISHRNFPGRFEDSGNPNVKLRSQFENRFSSTRNQGRAKGTCPTLSSIPSNNNCQCQCKMTCNCSEVLSPT